MPHTHNLTRFALWLALLLSLCAAPLSAQTPSPSEAALSLAEYRAVLLTAIAELEAAPEAEADSTVVELQERFATIILVELPSGDQVTVASVLGDLTADFAVEFIPDDHAELLTLRDIALARLRGAVAQIDASPTDNTTARLAILAQILARAEFNSPMSLWDRFWQWLENLLSEYLPDSQSGTNAGWLAFLLRALTWVVIVLIVAAIIWLLSYWLQRLLRSFVTDARIQDLMGDDDLPRSAAEARQQARIAAQSGLYRDAVRRLYLAALLQLSERDLIQYERSLTNREVLLRVPAGSPIRTHLEPVIATFDEVWYGVHEPDQATFTAYEQEIDILAAVADRTAAQTTATESRSTTPLTRGDA